MSKSTEDSKKQDLAELKSILSEVKKGNIAAASGAGNIAANYPNDAAFSTVLESIIRAEQAIIEAEKAKSAQISKSGLSAADKKAFEDSVAKDPVKAAKEYFDTPEMQQNTSSLDKIKAGQTISEKEYTDLTKQTASKENVYKRNVLSEGLGINDAKLKRELETASEPDRKVQITQKIRENKTQLEEVGKRDVHHQVVSSFKDTHPEIAGKTDYLQRQEKSFLDRIDTQVNGGKDGLATAAKLGASEQNSLKLAHLTGDTSHIDDAAKRVTARQAQLLDSNTVEIPKQSRQDAQIEAAMKAKAALVVGDVFKGAIAKLKHVETPAPATKPSAELENKTVERAIPAKEAKLKDTREKKPALKPVAKESSLKSPKPPEKATETPKKAPKAKIIDVAKMIAMFKRIASSAMKAFGASPMGIAKQKEKANDKSTTR